MVKLFWNTHNQVKKTKGSEKDSVDYIWGIYHKNNSNKWIYEVLKNVEYEIVESENSLEKNDVLIIIDSSIEKKIAFYDRLRLICSKMFLFHLGDESGAYDLLPIYKNFNYVWRTFCSNKYFHNNIVKCIPIGYKSGVSKKELNNRKYKWTFIGTPHKSSRHDLIFQLSNIKEFYCYKTEKFNTKIMSVNEMNEVLSSTEFIPCPNGFVHPETYRLYEALECECIPIVEDTYKYYDRLFPSNPFIKINNWSEAKLIIQKWGDHEIKKKQRECKIWWRDYKTQIQNYVKNKIYS